MLNNSFVSATMLNMINIPKCRCGGYKKVTWRHGKMYIANGCKACLVWKAKKSAKTKNYKMYKKDYCENCGFIAVNKCQLDVDHIDGDADNNVESNLQTLCSNCHRLKTHTNRDYVSTAANENLLGSHPVLFDLEYLVTND